MALTQVNPAMLSGSSNTTTIIQSNGTTAITIDASQNVGIGTTPSYKLDVNKGSSGAVSRFGYSGGNYLYTYADASGAYIGSDAGINDGIGIFPGHTIQLYTNSAERMRIDSSGNLLVGTTSTANIAIGGAVNPGTWLAQGLVASQNNADANIYLSKATGYVSSTFVGFYVTGTARGSITTNGTSVAYNTTSDYRLKENVTPMQNALNAVQQLKPVTYNWKADGSAGQGFIAHELQAICPEAVIGEKDAVDAEGNPVYQGIYTSFLVATLVAAIQELKAEVDALKAK